MGKRLYRSRIDRMVFGVCGGLGSYFDIDPVLIRVIFVLSIFFGGIGILAYIILAIVVPLENSQSAEPKQTIRENVQEMRETAETLGRDIKTTFTPESSKERTEPQQYYHARHSRTIIGLIILIAGILLLFGTISPFRWWWFGWAVFWPIVLIIIGILIIVARRR